MNFEENQNFIVTLVSFKNTKVFLVSDIIVKDDKVLKDYLGKIDILKLAHHGITESSCEFLLATKPDYVVISNKNVPNYSLINYMKDNFNQKIYLTGNAPGDNQNDEPPAFKLYFLTGEKEFFSDTERKLKDMKDMKVDHFGMERIMNLMIAKKILQIKFLLFQDLVKDFYHV